MVSMPAEIIPPTINLSEKINDANRQELKQLIDKGFEQFSSTDGIRQSFIVNAGNEHQLVTALLSLEEPPPLWQVAWSFNTADSLGLMSRLDKASRNLLLQILDEATQIKFGDEAALDQQLTSGGRVDFANVKTDVFAIAGQMISYLQSADLIPKLDPAENLMSPGLGKLNEAAVKTAVQQSLSGSTSGGSQAWNLHVANDSRWFEEILSLKEPPSVVWVALMRNEADPYRLIRHLDRNQRQKLLDIIFKAAETTWGVAGTDQYLQEAYDEQGRFHPEKLTVNWFAAGGAVIKELYNQKILPRPEEVIKPKPEPAPTFKKLDTDGTKQRIELPEAGTHGIQFRHIISDEAQSRNLLDIIVSEKSLAEARDLIGKLGDKSTFINQEADVDKTYRLKRKALVWLIGLTTVQDQKLGTFIDSTAGVTPSEFKQMIQWLDVLVETKSGDDVFASLPQNWTPDQVRQTEQNLTKVINALSEDENIDHFGLKAWILRSLAVGTEVAGTDVLALGLAMDELMKNNTALTQKYRLHDLLARFK